MTFFTNNISEPISGEDALHIKNSLRMKVGDSLRVNCNGYDYDCKIAKIDNCVYLDIIDKNVCYSEPSINITLWQAMPKGDKFEFIVQKAVELGVTKIVPVETKFTNVNSSNFNKKIDRYNKISKESAKQCNRGLIPLIETVEKFEKVLQRVKNNAIILYEEEFDSKNFQDLTFDAADCNIIIGSEGGFAREEILLAKDYGIPPVWLGKRILRCETASLVALSVIMYKSGNL
ncbi:ribosomal RNA small subunit methyltransferase E [Clostridia bacterium]|nr:ribosomal RNA small subunit methyltransferase E [Clostridia bacterium]